MILGRPYDGIVAGLILFAIMYPFRFKRNSLFRNLCMASLFVYIGSVISLTMIYAPPWDWNISRFSTTYALSNINFVPFRASIEIFNHCAQKGDYSAFIRLVGGNSIMLMPLGILVPLLFPKVKAVRIFILGSMTSLVIEITQLMANITLGRILRTVEIDDFIQNVVGCMLGYIVFVIIKKIYQRIKPAEQKLA